MTKDFSYLNNTTRRKTIELMIFSGLLMMFILIGSWTYMNWQNEVTVYTTDREAYINGLMFAGVLILSLIFAVILIHKAGGVRVRDIPAYQSWCQDQFKKEKEERKRQKDWREGMK